MLFEVELDRNVARALKGIVDVRQDIRGADVRVKLGSRHQLRRLLPCAAQKQRPAGQPHPIREILERLQA